MNDATNEPRRLISEAEFNSLTYERWAIPHVEKAAPELFDDEPMEPSRNVFDEVSENISRPMRWIGWGVVVIVALFAVWRYW